MNPKIFVGVAVAALAAVLGGILLMGPSIVIEPQENNSDTNIPGGPLFQPVEVTLADISIKKISDRTATINIAFEINNPNDRSMIVQTMDYQLFETGYSETEQVAGGQIGTRPEGMVEFGSNYYTLLGGNSITLKDTIVLTNTGNTAELWDTLQSDSAKWKVSGAVFFNLSSMTSGQENEITFEFTR